MIEEIEEIWKDIKGYEGIYQVSNLGKIKSLEKYVKMIDGRVRHETEKLRKLSIVRDYQTVTLYLNNTSKSFKVHRLVAEAFLSNPNNLPQINHINEIKLDNRSSNLEWCTALYNNQFSKVAQRWHLSGTEKSKKPVIQYDICGNFIAEFESATSAAISINKPQGRSSICKCCNKQLKTYSRFVWVWK